MSEVSLVKTIFLMTLYSYGECVGKLLLVILVWLKAWTIVDSHLFPSLHTIWSQSSIFMYPMITALKITSNFRRISPSSSEEGRGYACVLPWQTQQRFLPSSSTTLSVIIWVNFKSSVDNGGCPWCLSLTGVTTTTSEVPFLWQLSSSSCLLFYPLRHEWSSWKSDPQLDTYSRCTIGRRWLSFSFHLAWVRLEF